MNITFSGVSLTLQHRKVLDAVNFSLEAGHLVMLLGANGAGKTRLLKSLMGFHPYTGEILVDGQAHLSVRERAKRLAYVPQERESNMRERVWDFVLMGVRPHLAFYQSATTSMQAQAEQVLEQLEISHLRNRFLDEISGGECRLCYLARALLQNTPWLIMDEPITALDYEKQHHFLQILRQTVQEQQKGVLMSIHEPSLACQYADVMIFLQNGKILDIIKREEQDFSRMEAGFRALYGKNIALEDTTVGKTLVWREKRYDDHS